jgi:hypothetical protein
MFMKIAILIKNVLEFSVEPNTTAILHMESLSGNSKVLRSNINTVQFDVVEYR